MSQLSQVERFSADQDRPSGRCQHDLEPEACTDCAVFEIRDTLRQLRPLVVAAMRNPLVRRWLGV